MIWDGVSMPMAGCGWVLSGERVSVTCPLTAALGGPPAAPGDPGSGSSAGGSGGSVLGTKHAHLPPLGCPLLVPLGLPLQTSESPGSGRRSASHKTAPSGSGLSVSWTCQIRHARSRCPFDYAVPATQVPTYYPQCMHSI